MEKKIGKIVKHAGIKAGDAMSTAKDVVVQVVEFWPYNCLESLEMELLGEVSYTDSFLGRLECQFWGR